MTTFFQVTIILLTLNSAINNKEYKILQRFIQLCHTIIKRHNPLIILGIGFTGLFVTSYIILFFYFLNLGIEYNAFSQLAFYKATTPYLIKLMTMIILSSMLFKLGYNLDKKINLSK